MTKDAYDMRQLSRGSSLFRTEPQVELRNALRTNDIATFRRLLANPAVDTDYCYDYPDYKTCLDIACSEGRAPFVKLLLDHGVDVNKKNDTYDCYPIHFAVQEGQLDVLKILIDNERTELDVNAKCKSNTALLTAVKAIQDIDEDRESGIKKYEEIVEMLLKDGCDVNVPDNKGVTAIYMAAKQGLENVIKLIADYSTAAVDLDTYQDRRRKTARSILTDTFPHLVEKFSNAQPNENINNKLNYHISRHDESSFEKDFTRYTSKTDFKSLLPEENLQYELLEKACDKGLEKVVSLLLSAGVDPTSSGSDQGRPSTTPAEAACRNGYHRILRLLFDRNALDVGKLNTESLLQTVTRHMKCGETDAVNYNECLNILLKDAIVKSKINIGDVKNNTALHYAARMGDQESVLTLLRHGACIGLRNAFDEPPLADIQAKTLESYLDECIETNSERPSDEDYEIHLKYSFLVYPNKSLENESSKVPLIADSDAAGQMLLAPETDALLYMTQSEELRPLLKHPVITSFLYLKWQRISCLFYTNLTFYSLFWLCLILYILLGYHSSDSNKSGLSDSEKSDSEKYAMAKSVISSIAKVIAILGLIILTVRETMQLLVSPRTYLQSIENWLEIALIVITAKIVFDSEVAEHTRQQLSAVAILLSSAELVLLIGQFPALSTNIVMLKTVSWNFFKFLLWYCILIIAFALSFYTLFRKEKDDGKPSKFDPNRDAQNKEDDEENFFLDPGKSLFKTIVMLTGEFDAGSINFGSFPITSHIIFIVFVFMIPIVLFNLLNGLAVSDTQAIKADAELVGHIARIQLISYFESVLLGDKRQSKKGWLPCGNYVSLNVIRIKPLAKRICLFPEYLPKQKIIVKPNQMCTIFIPHDTPKTSQIGHDSDDNIESGMCFLRTCRTLQLNRKIVKDAKIIINEKTKLSEYSELKNLFLRYEEKIDGLENNLKEVLSALTHSRQ